jgi:hypothetical protein
MLNRLSVITLGLVAGACFGSSSARAQAPATVAVRAQLVVPRFRDRFTDRQAVEARIASLFADYLTREVGFLRFAANDTTLPYRLSFVLDHEPGNASSFAEVGFWVRLDRPGEDQLAAYWLPFRTSDQSLAAVGTETDFLTEVRSKLGHQGADSLSRGVLRFVPIAENGFPSLNPLGLVLPFPLLDLCMKKESVIQFVAEIQGTITMEEQFKAQIVGSAAPNEPFFGGGFGRIIDLQPPDDLSPSIPSNKVRVKKIFVTDYKLDRTACDNRAPRAVGGGAP